MTIIAAILALDALSILTTYHCSRHMRHGAQILVYGWVEPITRSELYALQTDWRR